MEIVANGMVRVFSSICAYLYNIYGLRGGCKLFHVWPGYRLFLQVYKETIIWFSVEHLVRFTIINLFALILHRLPFIQVPWKSSLSSYSPAKTDGSSRVSQKILFPFRRRFY